MDLPSVPRARHLAEQKAGGSRILLGASAIRPWMSQRVPAALQEERPKDEETCFYCNSLADNAENAIFVCAKWSVAREAIGHAVGAELAPETMVSLMLQSERTWMLIEKSKLFKNLTY